MQRPDIEMVRGEIMMSHITTESPSFAKFVAIFSQLDISCVGTLLQFVTYVHPTRLWARHLVSDIPSSLP
jgi:hypothetical protein